MKASPPRLSRRSPLATLLNQIVLIFFSLLAIYPVYDMVVTAFKTRDNWLHDQFGLPNPITFQNMADALSKGNIPLVVVNALFVWNELLIALVFLQSEESKTLMPGLTLFKGHFTVNEPLIMAGTLLATVPMLLLYLFGQKLFVEGLVAGAVK
jgi:ABC-type glycerol-3-phosphate transport system permease component